MRSLSPRFVLIDLHSSWHSANQVPVSTFAFLQNSAFISSVSSSFRRTRRIPAAANSPVPLIRSPGIRRPAERFSPGNGSTSNSPNSPSTSRSEALSELDTFLELVPLRMRKNLFGHAEIEDLIEVVMDLGRKPLARFPSGDWLISEQVVKLEDLQHAVSKVILVKLNMCLCLHKPKICLCSV